MSDEEAAGHGDPEYAAVILVTSDGSVAVQVRDDRPDIPDPGKLMLWAGGLHGGEQAEAGARRELEEETGLRPELLESFASFVKDPARHGSAGLVHVFTCRHVDPGSITVMEGQGFRLLRARDLDVPECSEITRDILRLFFLTEQGRRL